MLNYSCACELFSLFNQVWWMVTLQSRCEIPLCQVFLNSLVRNIRAQVLHTIWWLKSFVNLCRPTSSTLGYCRLFVILRNICCLGNVFFFLFGYWWINLKKTYFLLSRLEYSGGSYFCCCGFMRNRCTIFANHTNRVNQTTNRLRKYPSSQMNWLWTSSFAALFIEVHCHVYSDLVFTFGL